MRRQQGIIHVLLQITMMLASRVTVAYPGFQRSLLVRSIGGRRKTQIYASFGRYVTSNDGQSKQNWDLKTQSMGTTLEKEKGVEDATKTHSRNSIETLYEKESHKMNSSDTKMNSVNATISRSIARSVRKGAGALVSASGFLSSTAWSLIKDRDQWRRSRPLVDAFALFLNTSGIDLELSPSLNVHLLRNVFILGRIQKILAARHDRREQSKHQNYQIDLPSREEALRYMKYATAVYGTNMILAAEVDARGKVDTRLQSPFAKTRISEHIDVPEGDIVLVDVDYDGDGNHLRHFVAVDHAHRKVVLSIRGTFNLAEIIVDVAAFSRPFYGGEAHSEMATMAERVWSVAGKTVVKLLQQHDNYEFIITGHSLGAGTACLLNIMCHNNQRKLVKGRPVRCFAYAAPPVFTPLDLVPEAVQSTINYIHENDVVPFLSVDSVRHVFSEVRVIEEYLMTKMSRLGRIQLATGMKDPDAGLIRAVEDASNTRLIPKKGAPILSIPAAANVWMHERESGMYDYKVCDSAVLSTLGLLLDTKMMEDHFPPRYEHAFENLLDPPFEDD